MKVLVAVLVLVNAISGFAQSAPADESDLAAQMEEASRISDSAARLQAYDSIVQAYQLSTQSVVSVDDSRWVGSSRTDPFDDSRTVMLSLDSDASPDNGGDGSSLILSYASGRAGVFINWNTDLGATTSVTWRVGKDPAQTGSWLQSDNHQATFYPGDAAALIRKLKGADRLVARISPPGRDPVMVQFDLQGLGDAISRYAPDLGW